MHNEQWGWNIRLGLIAAVLGAVIPAASAADSAWANAAGGSFSTPGNWSAGVPGATDKATFNQNASYTVTWSASATNGNATFNAAGGTATLAIGANQWTVTGNVVIANNNANVNLASGTLNISNCFTNAQYSFTGLTITNGAQVLVGGGATIGWQGRSNSLEIAGAGSLLQVNGILSLGQHNKSDGILWWNGQSVAISNGGALRFNGGCIIGGDSSLGNRVAVNGAGSMIDAMANYFYIYGVQGQYLVTNGGQWIVTNSTFAISSDNNGECNSNRMDVVGAGSFLDVNTFNFSAGTRPSHDNRLRITGGGRMRVKGGINFVGTNNQLVAEGAGSMIEVNCINLNQDLSSTAPSVIVTNGATFTNLNFQVYIGAVAANCGGSILVSGAGSMYTNALTASDSVYVGNLSNTTGRITVQDGGRAYFNAGASTRYVLLGGGAYASGEIVVKDNNSLFQINGSEGILVGMSGQGRLAVSNGAVANVPKMIIGLNASSTSNTVAVDNATLYVTNATATALLEVRKGALTIGGASGTVIADTFTATNNSTLAFVADANGVTKMKVKGAMTVSGTAPSLLLVDLSAYKPVNGLELTLVEYGALPTPYPSVNITTIKPNSTQCPVDVVQSGGAIKARVKIPRGTTVTIH